MKKCLIFVNFINKIDYIVEQYIDNNVAENTRAGTNPQPGRI